MPTRARRRTLPAVLLALVAAGCAPSSKVLRKEIQRDAVGKYVAGVPFVRQRRNWCGPAALVAVARHHGVPLTQEQVAEEVYVPSIRGTLTLDLERCARAHGLWAQAGQASVDDVCRWLDRGVPLIALLRQGWLHGRAYHYVVLTGYHARRRYFIAHLGYLPNRPISFATFARRHRAAGRWILAACPPERVAWPVTADGHKNLGLLFERAAKLERARAEYQLAIAADASEPLYHFNLGNVLARLGQRAAAEGAYREAIRLAPRFAEAHNNLAHVLLAAGRRDEARRHAQTAVDIGGEAVSCFHDTLARALLALGRHADAAAAFRAAIAAAGKDAEAAADAHLGLIEALVRAGRRADALAEKNRLLARTIDPAVRRRADKLFE